MKVIRSEEEYKFTNGNVIALGNFDGLHIAHKHLILTAVKLAKNNALKSLVYIFDTHPISVINNIAPKLIIDIEQKLEIINSLGVDFVYIQKFDSQFSMMRPENFIIDVLQTKLACAYAVSGFDYKFGYKAQGDITLLNDICRTKGISIEIIDRIDYQKEPISASRIRKLLALGDMQNVNNLLGRRYQIRGTVTKGKSIGSQIGFPTANIIISDEMQIPAFGVYKTETIVDDTRYRSVTNIGNNPTVNGRDNVSVTCETHILDAKDISLYGKNLHIEFIKMIRKEQIFKSLDDLKKAIERDIMLVKLNDE